MKSFKITILILLVGIGFGACKDFLSPTPDNNYTKERFKTDPTWSLGVLINAYINPDYPRSYTMDEVATDDAVSNDQANNYMRMSTGEWSALFTPYGNTWTNSYRAIIYMNYFLTIVNDVQWSWQDTIKHRLFRERLTGEAHGFRAFYYARLLQQFGGKGSDGNMLGVPIVNTIISSTDDWKIQRSTYQQTADQVMSDYDKAIALMPYRYVDKSGTTPDVLAWNMVNGAAINLNRLDGRAAAALKARFALMIASPAYNNGNYDAVKADTAAKIAARLINRNGGLTASVGPDPIFWDDDLDINNADIIWRNDHSTSNSLEADNFPPSLYGRGRVNPTQDLVDAYPMKNGYPIGHASSTFNPADPYANRDPRLNKDILFNNGKMRITGSIGSNNNINTQADNAVNNDGLNKLPLYSTRTGYYMKKLMRASTNLTPGSSTTTRHTFPIIRWTEILLIYAEAANEVYGPDGDGGNGFTARQVIAAIRKRGAGPAAGGGIATDNYLTSLTTKEQMRDMIRNERRIELSFEGFRFWDLRRWYVPLAQLAAPAKGVKITGTTPKTYDYTDPDVNPVEERKFEEHMYYGPIPQVETLKFPGFIQNQGW